MPLRDDAAADARSEANRRLHLVRTRREAARRAAIDDEIVLGFEQRDGRGEALMRRVVLGDQNAFAELFDLYSSRVHGVVTRVVRDPAQSEDVTKEVFVEVWRKASHFDATRGALSAWIVTLAHRRAVDRVRAEQSLRDRERRALDQPVVAEDDPERSTVTNIDDAAQRAQLERALGDLTDLQRESIVLAYFRGYTYPQVADLLGIPLGTVKTRIRDGLIRLRDAMEVAR